MAELSPMMQQYFKIKEDRRKAARGRVDDE